MAVLILLAGLVVYPKFTAREIEARHQRFIQEATPGNTLLAQGKPAQAAAALRQVLSHPPTETCPELLAAYNNLATAQISLGHFSEAEKSLALAQARMDAMHESELASPAYRREKVRLVTSLANLRLANGKFAEAETLYQRAVTLTPEDAAAHANLANAFFLERKYADADTQFDLAVARQPDNPETLNNWGILLLNTRHLEEAEDKFRAAIKLNGNTAKYFYGLGLALRAQHRNGPALQAQRTAIHFNPNIIEPFLEMADIYYQLKNYQAAEVYLRGALKIDGNNMSAILALARLLAQTDDPKQRDYLESASLFAQAVELTHQQDVNLLTQLSDMYALAGAPEQAGQAMALALKRAREQHLSEVDIETLLQHQMQQFFLQCPPAPTGPNPQSTLGDAFGVNPKPADPFDNPKPETPQLPRATPIVPLP